MFSSRTPSRSRARSTVPAATRSPSLRTATIRSSFIIECQLPHYAELVLTVAAIEKGFHRGGNTRFSGDRRRALGDRGPADHGKDPRFAQVGAVANAVWAHSGNRGIQEGGYALSLSAELADYGPRAGRRQGRVRQPALGRQHQQLAGTLRVAAVA